MNIKRMRGVSLKKAMRSKSVAFRYHNKNNNGGNFGINIRDLQGKDYEISGKYNKEGECTKLRLGHIFKHGCEIYPKSFDHLVSIILYVVTPIVKKIGDL